MMPVPPQPRLGLPGDHIVQQTEQVFFGCSTFLSRACINATREGRYFDGTDGTRVVGIVEDDALAENYEWNERYFSILRSEATRFRRLRPNWAMGNLSENYDVIAVLYEESVEVRRLWATGRLRWATTGMNRALVSGLAVYAFDLLPPAVPGGL